MASTFAYHADTEATFEAGIRRHLSGNREWFAFSVEGNNHVWQNTRFVRDNADVTFYINREQLDSLMHAIQTAYLALDEASSVAESA